MIENIKQTNTPELFTELDTSPKQRVPKKVLDRNDFMLLFIKQLEYQDPLKPLENNEMATQLALFNQLDQLFDLNEKFEEIISLAKKDSLQTAANLIGKKALVKSELLRVENGTFLGGKLVLEEPVSGVKLKIYSAEGELIKEMDLGPLGAGEHEISWDARDRNGQTVPDGNYRLVIETNDPQEKKALTVKTIGRITAAILEDGDYQLLFNGFHKLKPSELEKIMAEEG